jgi:hypothetical protein
MAADTAKNDWVRTVLGVITDPNAPAGPREKLLPIWVAAKESADEGITKLQNALRDRDDEDLNAIVAYGLYGATAGESVGLMAALREADGKGTVGAYAKVIDAVADFRDFLDGAPIVDLIEANPFGVKVPLRATLGPALQQIARIAA